MKYNITTNEGELTSITVFHDGESYVATPQHPAFARIVEAVRSGTVSPADVVVLFDLAIAVGSKFTALSERVSAHGGRIYMDGVEVRNFLTQTIAGYYVEGHDNVAPLVAFMEKIETNPNPHSREHLFRWLEKHHFAITPDGDFIAYKGLTTVRDVMVSKNKGTALVNGVLVNGQIPNVPGSIIEMPRDQVQFDPRIGCSTGLHAGNWSYASNFGSPVVRVKINPRDVVSVPVDSNDEKLRVCRYKVLDKVTAEDRTVLYVDAAVKTLCNRTELLPPLPSDDDDTTQPKKAAAKKAAKAARKAAVAEVMPKKPAKKATASTVTVTKKAAAKAKPVVSKPKYYEDFKKADFDERPYKELQWLVREWEVKVVVNKAKPVLVDALTKAAATRRRNRAKMLGLGKKAAKQTAIKK